MKKRLMSVMLAAVLLLSVLSPAALAASFDIETIVSPKYEAVGNFSDGLAAVKQDGKWGYIDESGKMAISPRFDYAGQFSEGVAVVAELKETVHGEGTEYEYTDIYYELNLVDTDGNVTELYYLLGEDTREISYGDFDYLVEAGANWFCQNGVICVNGTAYTAEGEQILPKTELNGSWGAFDYFYQTGPCVGGVIPMKASYAYEDGGEMQCFFMDAEGNVLRTFPMFDSGEERGITSAYAPEQGRIIAWYGGYDEDWNWVSRCGAMDLNGNWVIQPQYVSFRYMLSGRFFCDGLWTVENEEGLFGAVDKDGRVVIPMQYDFMGSFTEGLCSVKKDGEAYYIDQNNNAVKPADLQGAAAQAESASHFSGGIAAVYTDKDGQAYCIQNVMKNGMLAAVPGTEKLGSEVYFPGHEEGSDDYGTVASIGDIIAIVENNKWGFARLTFHLDLPDESSMDSWAYDEVCKAIEAGLVPNELQNQYKTNITRADFALLFMEVASEITGKSVDELVKSTTGKELDDIVKEHPFIDTADRNIVAANAMGIINGRGNGIFDPYATITRQDAATLVLRAAVAIKADAMDVWGDKIAAANIEFNDGAAFAPYAQEAIEVMAALDVMKGVGNNSFAPTATYTRQQSFMTAYRLMTQIIEAE
ncbi:MAG: WG repeat-containing protein [Candidatus Heteroscillospira sp.]